MKRFLTRIVQAAAVALLLQACVLSVDVSTTPVPVEGQIGEVPEEDRGELPAWLEQGYEGSLLLIFVQQGSREVILLDLETAEETTIFDIPDNAFVTAAEMSPDGETVLITYAPAPPQGEFQAGHTGVYVLPADGGGEPHMILDGSAVEESYFFTTWSPDGEYIYYSHFKPSDAETDEGFKYTVERIQFPYGDAEVLVEDAFWPRLSPDGEILAYLTFEAVNNELYLADADGVNQRPAIDDPEFAIVDAPVFSPDGSTLLFSAPSFAPDNETQPWLSQFFGVRKVLAHNVPSDWWQVPAEGGTPQRLTNIFTASLYADYSPDGEYIASVSAVGVFIMRADGSGLEFVVEGLAQGTLDWIP
ncbi:MAG: hypothetical protein DWQ07_20780 [Chloroflexi bacterium]|nr:MAG: hypothetical protein DWQ07_20780 [Chloroflexota bacterium]MBL1194520.1 hypothetical protein [Chloroflexota bacterium]NOH11808.1 hypothetical protein [Chloroflexota bacterium]